MTDIAIIGTGFAGLCMGIRLKQAGRDDFVIYESGDGVGGTWRDNTYPGAACDVPSHLYSFSFEQNPGWSAMFSAQPEILAYLERCADKYDLRRHIQLRTKVTEARFDEARGRWSLGLTDADSEGPPRQATHRYVVSATGGLSQPKLPDIPGLDSLAGSAFHSARWDHEVDLTGKRVAVIGTGASAIQIVPRLAKKAAQLTVFQRTPAWVLPKPDRPISPLERRLYAALPPAQRLQRTWLYWTHEARAIAFIKYPRLLASLSKLVARKLNKVIPDPELRAKLTPDYTLGCKRILISNDYYPALRRDNVEVVTQGIERIIPAGIVCADQAREFDVIVLCTGFKAAEDVVSYAIYGLEGQALDEVWRGGAEAYLGTSISGFPNLSLLVGPNTGLGHNSMIFMIESQVNHAMSCVETLSERDLCYVDVRPEVQDRFNRRLQARMGDTVWQAGCDSWYLASGGKNTTLWPGFTVEFRARTRRIKLEDYRLVHAAGPNA